MGAVLAPERTPSALDVPARRRWWSALDPTGGDAPPGSVKRLLVALIVGLVVAAGVAAMVGSRGVVHRSQAVLAIDQPVAIAQSGDGGVIDKLARLRGKYAGLVRTDVIAEPVAERLDLPVGRVRSSLGASADPSSLLLTVVARDEDPERAGDLAEAAATALADHAEEEQASIDVPRGQRYVLDLVVPASDGVKIAPTRGRQLQAGVVGGVVTAAALYLALQVLAVQRAKQ